MNTKFKSILVSILILIINVATAGAEFYTIDSGNTTAEIDHYIFNRSVHEQMKVGSSYTVNVFVRNTGETRGNFRVDLSTYQVNSGSKVYIGGVFPTGEYIFPHFDTVALVLDKGESRRVEFKLVPIKPHIGDLEVSVDFYLIKSTDYLPGNIVLLDHASKQIHVIQPQFNKQERLLIMILLIMTLIIILYAVLFKQKNG